MRRVIIESPYAGDIEANIAYLRRCLHDCLMRNEAPLASHGLYTLPGVLDDNILDQRARGLDAGWAWYRVANACVVYIDRGISSGMELGIKHAATMGIPIEYRKFGILQRAYACGGSVSGRRIYPA